MKDIKIYSTDYCSYCMQAKSMLDRLDIPFEEIDLTDNPELRMKLSQENNGYRTVPMIFIDGEFIGGYNELRQLHQTGKLN